MSKQIMRSNIIEKYQKISGDISYTLLKENNENKALDNVLRKLGKTTASSRTYVFEINYEKGLASNTYEWVNPQELKNKKNPQGIEPQSKNLQNLPLELFPDWIKKLEKDKVINAADIHKYGFEEGVLNSLAGQGIKSILITPLYWNNKLHGFIGFDECKKYRTWDKSTVEFLRTNTRSIASFIKKKSAEDDLKKSERILRTLFETSPDGILIIDKKSKSFKYANPAVCKFLEYDKKEMEKLKVKDIHPQETSQLTFIKPGSKAQQGKAIPCLTKNRKIVYADINTANVSIEGRQCSIGFLRDVTIHQKTKTELQTSEGRLKAMLESINDYMCIIDRKLNIIWVNTKFKNIYGNNVIGRKCYAVIHNRKNPCHPSSCLVHKAFHTGKPQEYETKIVTHKGKTLFLDCTANVALRNKKGRPVAVIEIGRDITERKKGEEKLKEQKKILEQKNSALQEILEQIELEKNKIKNNMAVNIEKLLLPTLKKLKLEGCSSKHIDLMEANLKGITSSFGTKIVNRILGLTSREVEICSMIKTGFTGKEIAKILNISFQTVETHRKNIRQKLDIVKKDINLTTYLKTL